MENMSLKHQRFRLILEEEKLYIALYGAYIVAILLMALACA